MFKNEAIEMVGSNMERLEKVMVMLLIFNAHVLNDLMVFVIPQGSCCRKLSLGRNSRLRSPSRGNAAKSLSRHSEPVLPITEAKRCPTAV